mmetsp:Transcript_11961/g.20195  ORF Transcript_11961/g.20195 Transcript_11961/m.20195 type:complete len:229 (+) Transcript_11961:53-739(+)
MNRWLFRSFSKYKAWCWPRHFSIVTSNAIDSLTAFRRAEEYRGKLAVRKLRDQGCVPAVLEGDLKQSVPIWIDADPLMKVARSPFFKYRLVNLSIDGETMLVLPTEMMTLGVPSPVSIQHVTFTRWPSDPVLRPFKFNFRLRVINEEKCPQVKIGGYVHDMFSRNGVPFMLTRPDFPPFLTVDMAKADKGDIRLEHVELPEGARVVPTPQTLQNGGNFLLVRAHRIRG